MRLRVTIPSSFSRRRISTINLIAFTLAIFWWLLIGFALSPDADDFQYFRRGAEDQVRFGDPYASLPEWQPSATPQPDARPDEVVAYLYPPPLAYLLQPFAWFRHQVGQVIWFAINSVALCALIPLSIGLSNSERAKRYWGVVALGTLIAPPTRLCLQLGQLGIMLALMILGGYALVRRSVWRAGLLLAIAGLIKLYPALLGVYYMVRGPRRVAWWSIVFALSLFLASVFIYGTGPYISFVGKVLVSGYYPYAAEFNVSLVGFWDRLLTPNVYTIPLINLPILARILSATSALGVLAVCFVSIRRKHAEISSNLEFCTWLCAMLLLSPINGMYNLVLLLYPLLLVLRYFELFGERWVRNWLIIASVLVCWPPTWTDWQPALYNTLHTGLGVLFLTPAFYGVVLFFWLTAHLTAEQKISASIEKE